MENNNTAKKKEFFLVRWIKRAFFPNKEMDIYAEEQLQSPFRLVVRNFFSNKLAVLALIIVILITLTVFIAPNYVVLDLGEQDATLVNVAPGYNMMKYPSALQKNGVRDIAVGYNYSVGVDNTGKVYVWGKSRISQVVNTAKVPDEVMEADIVKVAAGADHVVALSSDGKIFCWGNDRLGQCRLPLDIQSNNRRPKFKIIKIEASDQFSAALDDEGNIYLWGNENFVELWVKSDLQGHIKDMALTSAAFVLLTDQGEVVAPMPTSSSTVTKIPEEAKSGVIAIEATTNTVAALKDDGSVIVWGAYTKNENLVPETSSKIVEIKGGRFHYTARLENGELIGWGNDRYEQASVPESVKNADIVDFYTGSFQNYAVDKNGKIYTWGLKGFICGTDSLGRDVFARLVNGGKMTMTIGALSVIIETIIGVILGGIAGYFGGWVDMAIMRISEIISSMPFIPFAMILSAVMGTKVSVEQRMYIIMVILGILSWPGLCSLVRAQMLAQREMEYVTAAKTVGVKESRIIFKHVIPNVMSVCLVSITLAFGTSMLTESTLSYLGFGVPLPTPTWGNMLTGANNSVIIQNYWWNWVFVGAIFGITCICINLIGDGLRDALDPKASGR